MTTLRAELPHASLDARSLVADYWSPRRAVWLIVAAGVVLRGWVAAAGFFYGDDYVFQGRAWRLPLDSSYLLHVHDGHLMPGAFAVQWGVTRAWPMNAAPLALIETVASALVVVLFARLALRLWSGRWISVVPVTIVAVSPMTLPSSTWWAAALNFLPMQLALVVTLSATVAWWQSRRQWHLWAAFVPWVVLLTFSEKVVLVPWVALAGVAVLDVGVGPLRAWARALRAAPALWGATLVVSIAYVAQYLRLSTDPPAGSPSVAQLAELVGRGVVTTVAPALLGGPLDWEPVGNGAALGQPPFWLVVASVEILAALVIVSVSVSRQARRAWVWVAVYVVGLLVLMAVGRLASFVDPVIVQGLRYTADATIPLALAVGVSLVAITPSLARWLPSAGVPERRVRFVLSTTAVALSGVMILLSIVSTARYRDIWRANASAAYIGNAAADLAAAKEGPPVIDQAVPSSVLLGLSFPYNQISWLLAPLQVRPDFGDPTTKLRVIDESGHLVPATVVGPAATPGPVVGCGWLLRDSVADIPLEATIVDFAHTVRIGYVASGSGSARFALGDGDAREVPFVKGAGEVTVTLVGGGTRLRVTDISPGMSVCTDDIRVGVATSVGP